MNVLIINQDEVRRLLPMSDCIAAMAEAFRALSAGGSVLPLRTATWLPDRSGLLGLMPGFLDAPEALGLKVVTVYPKNHGTPYDSHQGAVLLFDVEHGTLQAIIDAGVITAIRTAAATAVATDCLAREDAHTLAVLGSGVQARTHIESIRCVRDINRVRIWSRSRGNAEALAESTHQTDGNGVAIEVCDTAEAAVTDADIICTVTGSNEPVLHGDWIAPGTHINAVGACLKHARELDTAAVANAKLFVDWRDSTIHESGDYLIPLAEGAIEEDHIRAEIGELLLGRAPGRTDPAEITFFKSLGMAVQDLAAARLVYDRALDQNLGTRVPFGGPADDAG